MVGVSGERGLGFTDRVSGVSTRAARSSRPGSTSFGEGGAHVLVRPASKGGFDSGRARPPSALLSHHPVPEH